MTKSLKKCTHCKGTGICKQGKTKGMIIEVIHSCEYCTKMSPFRPEGLFPHVPCGHCSIKKEKNDSESKKKPAAKTSQKKTANQKTKQTAKTKQKKTVNSKTKKAAKTIQKKTVNQKTKKTTSGGKQYVRK